MAELGEMQLNPVTGEWEMKQTFDQTQNQWAWGENGLMSLGGQSPLGLIDPFLGVDEQYRGGTPITANTWQDAVRQSLEGFMRVNYGVDPVLNWDPTASGTTPGSNFRLGTLQELSNDPLLSQFFATSNLTRNIDTGQWAGPHGAPIDYDPLMGLDPSDKLLAFTGVPLEQIEKLVGGAPLQLFDQRKAAPYQQEIGRLTNLFNTAKAEYDAVQKQFELVQQGINPYTNQAFQTTPQAPSRWMGFSGGVAPQATQQQSISQALQQKLSGLGAQIRDYDQQIFQNRQRTANSFISLADAQNDPSLRDYNDWIFKLDIDKYTPPPEMIKASPESVLRKFFDTPAYRLAFGNDPTVLDPTKDPAERFRADPGYEWTQEEGFRQLQNRAAPRGLLESGATMRDLQNNAQGLADQNYQRWLTQNVGLFNDWQGKQQQMAMMGPQINGSSQALGLGQNLAQLSGQQGSQASSILNQLGLAGMQGYSNLGNAGLGAFGNLGSSAMSGFGNLGNNGLNSLTQAGIAQGNNMTQAKIAEAQIQAQQDMASQQGFGQIAGQLLGSFF